ncbi:MAG TPA: hypothetical protein VF660_01705 [Actinomycetota bacterium]
MTGAAGMMALVLGETAAGGAGFLFLTPLWSEVRRGLFYLTGAVVLVLAAGAAGAATVASRASSSSAARMAVMLSIVLASATFVWLLLMIFRLQLVARAVGIVTVPIGLAVLFAFARTGREGLALSFVQLLAGAAFTGAVLDGLLLGHWYLTDRKLTRGPINRMAWLLIASVALEAAAVIAGGFGPSTSARRSTVINPLLTIAGNSAWIAIGMVACTALIAVMIRLTLRGQRPTAVQSATGFFYLAVITAFTAELAAKVGFLS